MRLKDVDINWIKDSIKLIENKEADNKFLITTVNSPDEKVIRVKIVVEFMNKDHIFYNKERKPNIEFKSVDLEKDVVYILPSIDFYFRANSNSILTIGYYNNSISLYPIIVSFINIENSILDRKSMYEELLEPFNK